MILLIHRHADRTDAAAVQLDSSLGMLRPIIEHLLGHLLLRVRAFARLSNVQVPCPLGVLAIGERIFHIAESEPTQDQMLSLDAFRQSRKGLIHDRATCHSDRARRRGSPGDRVARGADREELVRTAVDASCRLRSPYGPQALTSGKLARTVARVGRRQQEPRDRKPICFGPDGEVCPCQAPRASNTRASPTRRVIACASR